MITWQRMFFREGWALLYLASPTFGLLFGEPSDAILVVSVGTGLLISVAFWVRYRSVLRSRKKLRVEQKRAISGESEKEWDSARPIIALGTRGEYDGRHFLLTRFQRPDGDYWAVSAPRRGLFRRIPVIASAIPDARLHVWLQQSGLTVLPQDERSDFIWEVEF